MTSMLVTRIRDKAVGIVKIAKVVKTTGAGKDSKESKGEYPKNLVQVLYIWYPITFWKKSVPVLTLFDSGNKVNAINPTFA